MVLPDEVARAADRGDVDAVRAFHAQHPERVDDVNDEDRTILQVASLPIGGERERRSLELVQLLATSTSTRLTDWQKYCLVPPKELLRLRSQIARGKAVAARSTPRNLAWLFSPDLPKEIAWRVFAYWNPRH